MTKNRHHHHSDARHTPLPPQHVKRPQNWDDNEEGDEGWETRAGAQDADASRAPGKFFFTILYIF